MEKGYFKGAPKGAPCSLLVGFNSLEKTKKV